MDTSEIETLIKVKHQRLYQWLNEHPDEKWGQGPDNKWTSGQHIIHLTQSAKALNNALKYPSFVLRWKFGKPNCLPRSYDRIVENYRSKLLKAGQVVSPFSKNMPETLPSGKMEIINALKIEEEKLRKQVTRRSEKNVDSLLIPHPLMGRMLLREILMWTAYHVEHHHETLKSKY